MNKIIRVSIIPGDYQGCGYYRMMQVMEEMNYTGTEFHLMNLGPATLVNAGQDVTYCQRVCTEGGFKQLEALKNNSKTKIIIDYDDIVWNGKDYKLHNYNMFLNRYNPDKNMHAMQKYLNNIADKVTCSTEYLKKNLMQFVDEDKITVIQNHLRIRDWLFDTATYIPNDDIFFYAGSSSHYNNDKKQYGDFDIPLANYLKDKKVVFQGDNPPFFMKPVANIGWTNLNFYSKSIYNNTRNIKFTLAPLVDNEFNRSKSDLKLLESCAIGRVCLVSDFENSPYHGAHPLQKIPLNASIGQIRDIVENAKLHYSEILKYQYEYLQNRWLHMHLNEYERLFGEWN